MADNNNFQSTVESLFKGMDSFLTTKTVIGDAIHIGGGGMGAKITPSAILVINKNGTKLVNVKNQDAITKILDMIPDIAAKFTKKDGDECSEEELEHILNQENENQE